MNADADAIANAEMSMLRFPNGLLLIYRGPLTLSNFQMAASKPSKIDLLYLLCLRYQFLKIEKIALIIWKNALIVFVS